MGSRSLEALHRLQEVETHLRSLENMLARKDRQLRQQEVKIRQLQEQIVTRKEEIRVRQLHIGQLELDFKTRDAGVAKLRTQLNVAKNNKEYSAILTQLNTEPAATSKLEERILEGLSQIDDMKKAMAEMEKSIEVETEQLKQKQLEQQDERQSLVDQIAELKARKAEVSEDLSSSDLSIFQRVADRNDGEAMAVVTRSRVGAEYLCDGCNMTIPMEIANALMTREDLQTCPICGRILFLDEQSRSRK